MTRASGRRTATRPNSGTAALLGKQGYSVMRAVVDGSGKVELEPFLEGFLGDAKADPPMCGRPNDVLVMRDGALLGADDYNGVVYRISYRQ